MNLIRIEGILPKNLDRDLPPELQYEKEREVYAAWRCKECGSIFAEDPKGDWCYLCKYESGFYEVEVDENLEEVEE